MKFVSEFRSTFENKEQIMEMFRIVCQIARLYLEICQICKEEGRQVWSDWTLLLVGGSLGPVRSAQVAERSKGGSRGPLGRGRGRGVKALKLRRIAGRGGLEGRTRGGLR